MKKINSTNGRISAGLSNVRMTVTDNKQIIFEGSKGIVEYNDKSIKINSGKYLVAFSGRSLHISSMNEYDLIIEGFITSIEYIM